MRNSENLGDDRSVPLEGADSRASDYRYAFTVFTATHDRARSLHRPYQSLLSQTLRDFEWLIVDDGSTDGTADMVRQWQSSAPFPIRYVYQEHAHKHIALRRGVAEARGRLFVCLDSDDECVPTALERFLFHWNSIAPEKRSEFNSLMSLCQTQAGDSCCTRFPEDVMDVCHLDMLYRYRFHGESWFCHTTDALREVPFPDEYRGIFFPEGIVLNRIARGHKTRYFNEVLRIYWVDGPSLTKEGLFKNTFAARMENMARLNDEIDYFRYYPSRFFRSSVHYARFSFHQGVPVLHQIRDLHNALAKSLCLAATPLGRALYLRDRRRSSTASSTGSADPAIDHVPADRTGIRAQHSGPAPSRPDSK